MPWPRGWAWRMAMAVNFLAFVTAERGDSPRASKAVIAAEKVQPVPWV